jgi:hypothetical protein
VPRIRDTEFVGILERVDALLPVGRLAGGRGCIANGLDVEGAERAAWLATPRAPAAADLNVPLHAPASTRGVANLPADLTSFVGRANELARLVDQPGSVRLLALVGPGGVGKIRLATRLASHLGERYRDGVCLVELANQSDTRLVPNPIASALGITKRPRSAMTTTLLGALRECELLLVLDNCEHVLDGCADMAHAVLHACPSVQLLATSREPLRIVGEVTWPVPPLSLDATTAENDATSETVQLFIERARAVDPLST